MIYALRDNDLASVTETYPVFSAATQIRVEPATPRQLSAEIDKLIDLCTRHEIGLAADLSPTWLKAEIVNEAPQQALLLALYIIFDRDHRPFSEIVQSLWNQLPSELSRKLVSRVAVMHQFESLMFPRVYSLVRSATQEGSDQSEVLEAYQECLEYGVLVERMENDEPCVLTPHSLIAERVLRVAEMGAEAAAEHLTRLLGAMRNNTRELEILRRFAKRVTDYEINLGNPAITQRALEAAADASSDDWVVCQQYAKYLVKNQEFARAEEWIARALRTNPEYSPLVHTRGHLYFRWGIASHEQGDHEVASEKFRLAADLFNAVRAQRERDEYSYVTHLDMLIFRQGAESDEIRKAHYLAEGAQLYSEATKSVPQQRLNFLLNDKYRIFDVRGDSKRRLCELIVNAINTGESTDRASVYVAEYYYSEGRTEEAINLLEKHLGASPNSSLAIFKLIEFQLREGNLLQAQKQLEWAKTVSHGSPDSTWNANYYNALITVLLGEFSETSKSLAFLSQHDRDSRYPRGYVWKKESRSINPKDLSFLEHAKLWSGRVERVKLNTGFGLVEMTNVLGHSVSIPFYSRYWKRKDIRENERIDFVLTILSDGLRADDPNDTPFTSRSFDIFI